jgi:hypothetical protein
MGLFDSYDDKFERMKKGKSEAHDCICYLACCKKPNPKETETGRKYSPRLMICLSCGDECSCFRSASQ